MKTFNQDIVLFMNKNIYMHGQVKIKTVINLMNKFYKESICTKNSIIIIHPPPPQNHIHRGQHPIIGAGFNRKFMFMKITSRFNVKLKRMVNSSMKNR